MKVEKCLMKKKKKNLIGDGMVGFLFTDKDIETSVELASMNLN